MAQINVATHGRKRRFVLWQSEWVSRMMLTALNHDRRTARKLLASLPSAFTASNMMALTTRAMLKYDMDDHDV